MRNALKVVLFILAFVGFLVVTKDYWEGWLLGTFSLFVTLSVIFISFVIFLENRHPTKTLTWLVLFSSFPLVGFILYFLLGQNYRKKRLFRKKALLDEQTFRKLERNEAHDAQTLYMKPHQQPLLQLARRMTKESISTATQTRVLTNGEETFAAIFAELEKAEHHIHLEYYIVRDDDIGQRLKQILMGKAKKGVHVRFLYDAVGSWQLSKTYIQEMREAGVDIIPFSPVRLPFLNNKINFRNHRKIIVVDGKVGFVGGLNIGDEYLGKNEYFGFWRDTHLFVYGEAVRTLQLIFLQDWYYMTGQQLLTLNYLSAPTVEDEALGGVQLVAGDRIRNGKC